MKFETFAATDASQSHAPISLDSYYKSIRILKSELIANLTTTRSSRFGYNYLVFEFEREYPHAAVKSIQHYSLLDYARPRKRVVNNNESVPPPFEIEKFTGKLFYMLSEDTLDFDRLHGEKSYDLVIRLTDYAQQELDYFVTVTLVDDDELFYTTQTGARSLTNKLFIEPGLVGEGQLIGQVNVIDALKQADESDSLMRYVEILQNNPKKFHYEIMHSNDHDGLFRVDETTGLVYAARPVIQMNGDKFKKLVVRVSGRVGQREERRCLFFIDVYVFMRTRRPGVIPRNPVKFVANEFNTSVKIDVDVDFGLDFFFEPVEISRLISAVVTGGDPSIIDSNVRYKMLRNHHDRCEINWFNGKLRCRVTRDQQKEEYVGSLDTDVDKESFSILIATYDFHNRVLFDSAKVRNLDFYVNLIKKYIKNDYFLIILI